MAKSTPVESKAIQTLNCVATQSNGNPDGEKQSESPAPFSQSTILAWALQPQSRTGVLDAPDVASVASIQIVSIPFIVVPDYFVTLCMQLYEIGIWGVILLVFSLDSYLNV